MLLVAAPPALAGDRVLVVNGDRIEQRWDPYLPPDTQPITPDPPSRRRPGRRRGPDPGGARARAPKRQDQPAPARSLQPHPHRGAQASTTRQSVGRSAAAPSSGACSGVLATIAARGNLKASRMPALFLQLKRNMEFWEKEPDIGWASACRSGRTRCSPALRGLRAPDPAARELRQGERALDRVPGAPARLQAEDAPRAAHLDAAGGLDARRRRRRGSTGSRSAAATRRGRAAWRRPPGCRRWPAARSSSPSRASCRRPSGRCRCSSSRLPLGVRRPLGARLPLRALLVLVGPAGAERLPPGDHRPARLREAERRRARLRSCSARVTVRRGARRPRYDTGNWSLYALPNRNLSTWDYHVLVTGFLENLCERTGARVYCRTARRFARYTRRARRAAARPAPAPPAPAGDAATSSRDRNGGLRCVAAPAQASPVLEVRPDGTVVRDDPYLPPRAETDLPPPPGPASRPRRAPARPPGPPCGEALRRALEDGRDHSRPAGGSGERVYNAGTAHARGPDRSAPDPARAR